MIRPLRCLLLLLLLALAACATQPEPAPVVEAEPAIILPEIGAPAERMTDCAPGGRDPDDGIGGTGCPQH